MPWNIMPKAVLEKLKPFLQKRQIPSTTYNRIYINEVTILDPRSPEQAHKVGHYADLFFEKRKRRGFNRTEADKGMFYQNYFGAMMVETGEADAFISGLTRNYIPDHTYNVSHSW
jgi:phosphotransacetylase